ncbi:LysR substrate-binding domain-containing protein [Paraburkholderia tagetis]|uniref:LysR substrate-binding domain-containing protein n=1 Tax=Paraburkholderia tagetis TaxID=2913261 RepID=A0A9X1RUL9_9BURK|nr:LysR substrate-binding domain-containing protein [Paraburkholderia tagetis]MCG5076784.1 LysR substrate-binding domain-containing protein [Paraburkholderia tagetis]
MKLHQLRTLAAIADAGGIRGAARTLDASPAAITKSLRQLEELVQMPLVTRTSSGVTLTEYGQTLLVHARLVIGQMTRAREAVDAMRGAAHGKLSIAITPWLAMTFLPETIRRFSLRMPDIRLELFEGLLKIANPRLRDGSLDFFIGRPMPGDLGVEFNYRPLFSSSCAVVVRQGHPLANCRSLGDLCGLDWLLTLDPSDDGRHAENMFERNHCSVPRRIHLAHSFAIAIALLQQSDMASVIPWPLAELCAAREGLCAVPVREQLEDAAVGLISRSGHPLSAVSECFIQCLVESVHDAQHSASPDTRNVLKSVDVLI